MPRMNSKSPDGALPAKVESFESDAFEALKRELASAFAEPDDAYILIDVETVLARNKRP